MADRGNFSRVYKKNIYVAMLISEQKLFESNGSQQKEAFSRRNMIFGHFMYTIFGFSRTAIIKNTFY